MNYFKIELAVSGVEIEYCALDGLYGEVSFINFVDCQAVNIGIVNKLD